MEIYLAWFILWVFGSIVLAVVIGFIFDVDEFKYAVLGSIVTQGVVAAFWLIIMAVSWALEVVGFK